MSRIAKSKKKIIKAVIISVFVVSIAFGIAYAVSIGHLKSSYNYKLARLNADMSQNQVTAYVATEDIAAGNSISEEKLIIKKVYHEGGSMDELITEEDIGKIAVADITAGKPIYKSMVGSDLEDGLRETEYACLQLGTNLKKNDFVDVRIWYPNGENYIVLSKVCLKNLKKSSNNCMFWLNERQIMLMSSAIVDAYMYSGSIIYTTKYIEDGQKELIPNYTPTKDCITAIANDSNIVSTAEEQLNASIREALDIRLEAEDETKNNVDLKDIIPGYSGEEEEDESVEDEADTGTSSEEETGGDGYE